MKWPKNVTEAREFQELYKGRVIVLPLKKEPEYVAGADAAFTEDSVFAAACLYRLPEFKRIEQSHAVAKATFPYVPGYLFFREGPAIMTAVKKLTRLPDILLVDGQGIAHPRGIGSASHLGVLLDIPVIGCAKTRLVGEFKEPGARKGSWSPLHYESKIVGAVLRTKDNVRSLFVSPGHKINTEGAIRIALACTGGFRMPEPLRCADHLARELKSGSR